MTAIDGKHFEVIYTQTGSAPSAGARDTKTVSIPFFPHVRTYSEVRGRLVDMSNLSERVVTKRKPIIIYKQPKFALFAAAVIAVAYLALRTDAIPASSLTKSIVPGDLLARWNELRERVGGRERMDGVMKSIARIHVVECVLMAIICRFKGGGSLTTIKWALTTLIVGFPSWIQFFTLNSSGRAMKRAIFGPYGDNKKNN